MATAARQTIPVAPEDIAALVSARGNPAETLRNLVQLVARRWHADVCSLYLLEPDRSHLLLAATVGLRRQCVGKLRMAVREGLAGLVAEQLRPLALPNAMSHPRFKYFREAGEDDFQSFLGVPVVDHGVLQGVLVLQTVEPREFPAEDVDRLVETVAQMSSVVGESRRLEHYIAPVQERLWALAWNLWWSWNEEGDQLFRSLDPQIWREVDHNPVALLMRIPLPTLEERIGQMLLHSRINNLYHRMQEYLANKQTWAATRCGDLASRPVAYFSAEFGLHESLPIYSGGLGVLAGDHIKSASDLGVPLVGVGLFYSQGYFRQRLDVQGRQVEEYVDVNMANLPLSAATDRNGQPLLVRLETRTGAIMIRVWRLAVGRCTLLLLDTNVEGNSREDRELTARLYDGDQRVRIRQELILGVGGLRALHALGIHPGVLHLNEGHSAFAVLEMVRFRMRDEGLSFEEACRQVAQQSVFTTHTPVPAGHDRFTPDMIEEHLGPLRDALEIPPERLLALGRVDAANPFESFCMTVLALKLTRRANAVSLLHGNVSRQMWSSLWPWRAEEHVPIGHITNGVHVHSWLAPQVQRLYDRNLGTDWRSRSADPEVWRRMDEVNDHELWETHLSLKSSLIDFVRRRVVRDAERRGEPAARLASLRRILSADALTIGFARRFATYKRGDLIFYKLPALIERLRDPQRPVQLVFAGKAHPLDEPGKAVLQRIAHMTLHPDLQGRVVFVEDYDINVARHLIQGVDVWLNTPRRPLEASGTSGQKVVLNGGLNLSILDGWWAEAYDGGNGFAIGSGRTHVRDDIQDVRDADALAEVLREEVIPLYYSRDEHGLPRAWIARMKQAIRTLGWRFNADRMMMDYVEHGYVVAASGRSSEMAQVR